MDQFQEWPYTEDAADDIANMTGLNFPEDNAGFLVGALAAMMSESNVIGAVCGTDVVPPFGALVKDTKPAPLMPMA